jgi:predicted membrane channel-forming protein YqfA (hemolysin III family)
MEFTAVYKFGDELLMRIFFVIVMAVVSILAIILTWISENEPSRIAITFWIVSAMAWSLSAFSTGVNK